jgi:hypothetical protein
VDELASWILLPLALVLASWGTGLLVSRAFRTEVPDGLVLPLGFAGTMVLLSIPYRLGAAGPLATALLVLPIAAGFWLGRGSLRASLPSVPVGLAALGIYLLYIAPVALSGAATFAGYTFLGDNAVHFSLVDHVREQGAPLGTVPSSSYGELLARNLGSGYPLGPHFQLASLTTLLGTDVAWLYQGYLATVAALVVIPAARLLAELRLAPWACAAGGFTAAAAYLPFSYGLQGGAKELIMIMLVLLGAVLAVQLAAATRPLRPALMFAVPGVAAFIVYSAGGLPWLGLMGLVAIGMAVVRSPERGRTLASGVGAMAAVFAVGAAASIASAVDFFAPAKRLLGSTSDADEGNLVFGLKPWEALGIWPTGDFRFDAGHHALLYPVVLTLAALVVAGAVLAVRRRAFGLLFAAGAALAVWAIVPAGIYIEAKFLTILSPALVLLAVAGCAAVAAHERLRPVGLAVAAALAAGVLFSDVLAYRDAYIAPEPRLDELRELGEAYTGGGPTMLDEMEEYGKHFLRHAGVIAPFDGYASAPAQLRTAGEGYDTWADLDEMTLDYVRHFPLVVRPRNPVASRPPAPYRRVYAGRYYEVWRAAKGIPAVADHIPLGDDSDPTDEVDCAAIRELAGHAGGGELVAAVRPSPLMLRASEMQLPAGWPVLRNGMVRALGAGTLSGELTAPAGRYRVWVRGSFGRGVDVRVDDRSVGRAEDVQTREQMALVGEAGLGGGSHSIALMRGGPGLGPGNGRDESYQAVFLEPVAPTVLKRVRAERASSLCGTRADWVELLAP